MSRKNFERLQEEGIIDTRTMNICGAAAVDVISIRDVRAVTYLKYNKVLTRSWAIIRLTNADKSVRRQLMNDVGVYSMRDLDDYEIRDGDAQKFYDILQYVRESGSRITIDTERSHTVGIIPVPHGYWEMYGTWGPFQWHENRFAPVTLFGLLYKPKGKLPYYNVEVLPPE